MKKVWGFELFSLGPMRSDKKNLNQSYALSCTFSPRGFFCTMNLIHFPIFIRTGYQKFVKTRFNFLIFATIEITNRKQQNAVVIVEEEPFIHWLWWALSHLNNYTCMCRWMVGIVHFVLKMWLKIPTMLFFLLNRTHAVHVCDKHCPHVCSLKKWLASRWSLGWSERLFFFTSNSRSMMYIAQKVPAVGLGIPERNTP